MVSWLERKLWWVGLTRWRRLWSGLGRWTVQSDVRRARPGLRMSTMIDLRECVRAVRASQSTQGIDDVLLNLILTDKVKMFDKFAIAKTLSTQLISNESPTRHTTIVLTGSISSLRYDWVNEWRPLEMPRTYHL